MNKVPTKKMRGRFDDKFEKFKKKINEQKSIQRRNPWGEELIKTAKKYMSVRCEGKSDREVISLLRKLVINEGLMGRSTAFDSIGILKNDRPKKPNICVYLSAYWNLSVEDREALFHAAGFEVTQEEFILLEFSRTELTKNKKYDEEDRRDFILNYYAER